MLRPYGANSQLRPGIAMRPGLILLAVVSLMSPLAAQEPFDFYSRGPYRPTVPRPESVTGYAAGDQHTMYAVMQHYLDTLVATASDRVRIETWGRTSEYRPIRALIISDPANLAKLDQIRGDLETRGAELDRLDEERRPVLEQACRHPTLRETAAEARL